MLTSLQNPLVKQMRKLHRARERHEQNLCLLEGTHLIASACELAYPFETLCATPQWQEKYPQLWKQASQTAKRAEVVSPTVLEAIATTVNPDGIVATASRRAWETTLPSHLSLGIALERLQDPGNVGTIIRTAAATEVEGMWISADSVDLDHPKVLRSSAGAWFRLPMAVACDLEAVVKAFPGQTVATLPQADLTYWEIDFSCPTLILLGNEGAGLSPQLAALADRQVSIPLAAGVESLNVAIAAALLLYEAQRQRRLTN